MSRIRSHQVDIYGAWFHATADPAAWKRLRRRIAALPNIEDGALGFTSCDTLDDGSIHVSVFLDMARLTDTTALIEILAHEAAHAATMLLDEISEEYDGESEALAYLVGWTAAWVHTALTS